MNEKYKGTSPITWPCFMLGSTSIEHFISSHNCNYPPFRMTERSIELALANIFLRKYQRESVVEIGAVTPYYWPHRIPTVVDPSDTHPQVLIRDSFLNFDLGGRPVLSISTFEHIGLPEYGLTADEFLQQEAVTKLLDNAGDFLVTIPGGYNPKLDQLISTIAQSNSFKLHVWQRYKYGNDWIYLPDFKRIDFSQFSYGPFWANTLLVLHRGEDLI